MPYDEWGNWYDDEGSWMPGQDETYGGSDPYAWNQPVYYGGGGGYSYPDPNLVGDPPEDDPYGGWGRDSSNTPGGGGGGGGGGGFNWRGFGQGLSNALGGLDLPSMLGYGAAAAGGAGLLAYGLNQDVPDILLPPWQVDLDPTAQMYLGAGSAPMPTDIGGFDWRTFLGAGAAPIRDQQWNDQFNRAMAWPGADQLMGQIGTAQGVDWGPAMKAAGGITGAGAGAFSQALSLASGGAGAAGQERGYSSPEAGYQHPDLYRTEEAAMIKRAMEDLREDPAMKLRHERDRVATADRLRAELGPDFAATRAGQMMMVELERRIDDELFARERGDIEQAQKSADLIGALAGRRAQSATQAAGVRTQAGLGAAQIRNQAAGQAADAANRAAAVAAQVGASQGQIAAAAANAYNQIASNQGQLGWQGVNALGNLQNIYQSGQIQGLDAMTRAAQADRANAQFGFKGLGDIARFNQDAARWGFGQYQGTGEKQRAQALDVQAANVARRQGEKLGLLNLAGTLAGTGLGGLSASRRRPVTTPTGTGLGY